MADKLLELVEKKKVKAYDLSQLLGIHTHFWPYYPPFEMKYFKRKSEHGVNAQYIQSSWHIGTHLDSPRHFLTRGKTIDQLPLDWTFGPGVIVDLTDEMDDLAVYTPKMIEDRADVHEGDILILHTGWHKYAAYGTEQDEERYILRHPGAHPDMVNYLIKKKIHIWGVDAVSTDHPMDLPIGRFLGKGTFGQCDRVRALCEKKFGGKEAVDKLFPLDHYQLTHNRLFDHDCIHLENLGGEIGKPELQNKRVTIVCTPIKIEGAESAWTRVLALLAK
jgi:kynurenine formamidase